MGASLEFRSDPYPPPNKIQISKRVLAWLEANQLSVMEDAAESQLADDLMVGWEMNQESERRHLGLMATCGLGDPDSIDEFRHLSLMRGQEVWDMTIACARSLQSKHAGDPESLEGQDLLSFIAKLMVPTPEEAANQTAGPKLSRSQMRTAKRKREIESHFFEKPAHGGSTNVQREQAMKAEKKAERKEKKRRKRNAKRAQLRTENKEQSAATAPSSTAAIPALQDAAAWYRSNYNISVVENARDQHDKAVKDYQESTSGSQNLREGPNGHQAGDTIAVSQELLILVNTPAAKEVTTAAKATPEAAAPVTGSAETRRSTLRSASKLPVKISYTESASGIEDALDVEPAGDKKRQLRSKLETPRKLRTATSKFFAIPTPSPLKAKSPRPPRGTVSALPFPTLSATSFGLVQEKLADDPFRLMIAIAFLVRTPGRMSVPVFWDLMERYPTPEALMNGDAGEIAESIKHLGLSVVRTAQIQKYARIWVENPPTKDTRYAVKNYPRAGDGSDVRSGEQLPPEDQDSRVSAWEIGHMTQGPYAIDSWRIFCRDVLLERAQDWKGKGREPEFQPEWMRVVPLDKELRAYLRWMWMRDGWDWDPMTGEREPLSEALRRAVDEGCVQWDNTGALQIIEAKKSDGDGMEADVDA